MKKLLLAAVALGCMLVAEARGTEDVRLPQPDLNKGLTVMKALSERQSVRECAPDDLSLDDLSGVLWAANGVNRPETGGRTAPSALGKQDIDIYVFTAEAVYLYDHAGHSLKHRVDGDHRGLVAGQQDFVKTFPVVLLFVSDTSRFGMDGERVRLMAAMDAGIVSQNVSLYCAANGLCTVPRASMDTEGLCKLLNLTPAQLPMMNNPVGYPKK